MDPTCPDKITHISEGERPAQLCSPVKKNNNKKKTTLLSAASLTEKRTSHNKRF